ncbi:MAG: hypothetical protein VCF08_12145 [Alphaproteobacteria bacterium]
MALRRQQPYLSGRRFYLIYLDNPILTAHGNHGQDHDGENAMASARAISVIAFPLSLPIMALLSPLM